MIKCTGTCNRLAKETETKRIPQDGVLQKGGTESKSVVSTAFVKP